MNYYNAIVKTLQAKGELELEISLRRCIDEETSALLEKTKARRTARAIERAKGDAQEFYAAEILTELFERPQLFPKQVLGLRRRANTWAIAEIMRGMGLVLKSNGPQTLLEVAYADLKKARGPASL